MAQLGADVEQLDALSRRFRENAEQLRTMTRQLGSQVHAAWWQGADADRFRGDWDGTYSSQLEQVAARLEETSQSVASQASQQRQASGS